MKNLLIIFLISYSHLFSQKINREDNTFTEVTEVEKKSKDIYNSAKEWVVTAYKKPKEVIQIDTEEKILLRGILDVKGQVTNKDETWAHTSMYNYDLELNFKENKYRKKLTITSIRTPNYTMMDNYLGGGISTKSPEISGYIDTPIESLDGMYAMSRWNLDEYKTNLLENKDEAINKMVSLDPLLTKKKAEKYYLKSIKDTTTLKNTIKDTYFNTRAIDLNVKLLFKNIDEKINSSNDDEW